jgi:hypothetical protein
MVARRRKTLLRAVIPLGVASFIAGLTVTIAVTAARDISERERTFTRGEYAAQIRAAPESPALGELAGSLSSAGYLVSHAWTGPGLVSGPWGTVPATLWYTDIPAELRFRGLIGEAESAEARAVLLAPPASPEPGEVTSIALSAPGLEPVVTGAVGITVSTGGDPVVLLPWEALTRAETGPPPPGSEVLRVRGERPLARDDRAFLTSVDQLSQTGWRSAARLAMRPLWAIVIGIGLVLYLVGAAAAAPALGIIVRRFSSDFTLLLATGYRQSYVRRLVAAMGTMAAAFAGAAGAVAALAVTAILGSRGLSAEAVLPLFWLAEHAVTPTLYPQPQVVIGLAATALAALAGGLSALPAIWLAGSMGSHRNQLS